MKIYIRGMSVSRSFLLGKLEGYADVIEEHILKIVTAEPNGNTKYVDKWINDIARAIYNISKYTLAKGKRLDANTYKQYIFDEHSGTTKQDMKYILEDFKNFNVEYSNFEPTDEMAEMYFNIVEDLKAQIPQMLADIKGNDGVPIPNVVGILRRVFLKYISFTTGRDNWGK